MILLYNPDTRQFRFPVFLNGRDGFLIEAAAGLLDNASPETRIVAEAEEETGFRVTRVENVFEAFMRPGSVTEKLYFFIAEYDERQRSGEGAASSRRVKISTCWSWISIRRYGRSIRGRLWMRRPSCCCSICV